MTNLNSFKTTFSWYRNLTLELIRQFPEALLRQQLSERSIPINIQFIDLGDMQLKIAEKVTGKTFPHVHRPSNESTDKNKIIEYLVEANKLFFEALQSVDVNSANLDWFGRMDFNFEESLSFLLAHEAMHHGEILSFIFAKDLPMPEALKNTWGFER